MAEEILLDYKINRPNVSTERQETDLKVLLKINASNALRAGGGLLLVLTQLLLSVVGLTA